MSRRIDLLYKRGDYQKAAQYAKAADTYRDRLSVEEQTLLDQYRAALAQVQNQTAADGNVAQTSDAASTPASPASAPMSAPEEGVISDPTHVQAAALLTKAREEIALGRFDNARALVKQAEGLKVTYGVDEDTPLRVLTEIEGRTARDDASNGRRQVQGDLVVARLARANSPRQFRRGRPTARRGQDDSRSL